MAKNEIIQVSDNKYTLRAYGSDMTLIKEADRWAMYTVNAAVRAHNNGYAIAKYFGTLELVEAKYKSWRGIALLVKHSDLSEQS